MFVTCKDSDSRVYLDAEDRLVHEDATFCYSQEFVCHHDDIIPADLAKVIVKMMGVVQ